MGYDMRVLNDPTDEENAANEHAVRLFNEAARVRDALPEGSSRSAASWSEAEAIQMQNPEMSVLKDDHFTPGWVQVSTPEFAKAQEAVLVAHAVLRVTDSGYFRLNIGGMGRVRLVMEEIPGMIHYEQAGMPEDPPVSQEQQAELDLLYDTAGHETYFRKTYELWPSLAWAPEAPGICGWKCGSNDPWLITPFECMSAVQAYEKAVEERTLPEDIPDYFIEWVDFLRRAIRRGGIVQG
jgi:hypothetical protein